MENNEQLEAVMVQLSNLTTTITTLTAKVEQQNDPTVKWINQNLHKEGSWYSEMANTLKGIMFRQRELVGNKYTGRIKACVKGQAPAIMDKPALTALIKEKEKALTATA